MTTNTPDQKLADLMFLKAQAVRKHAEAKAAFEAAVAEAQAAFDAATEEATPALNDLNAYLMELDAHYTQADTDQAEEAARQAYEFAINTITADNELLADLPFRQVD